MSNTLGVSFTVSSFGESHGPLVGVLIDGCPAGLPLSETDLQYDLDRRRPGENEFVTPRNEPDLVDIWSGVFNGHTTGAPLCLAVQNINADSNSYKQMRFIPRPGHADYVSYVKYSGWADYRGGGRFSGRITAGFVMAGAVAKKLLATLGVDVVAYTSEIGSIKAAHPCVDNIKESARRNPVYCPNQPLAEKMMAAIAKARDSGDSLGGVVEVVAANAPSGLGEPVFDTLDGQLAKAFFAIPGVKAVEFGEGFGAARLKGSENNDALVIEEGKVRTSTNHAGGILGGLSNGMPILARVAIKPTPSISNTQRTVNLQTMEESEINITGRHDPCIVPRAVVVVEAVTAIVLCDFAIRAGLLPGVLK
jgi:chorismate synthase